MTETPNAAERWLITGAAGFIGSNLAEGLLRDGHHVVGLDNFSAGTRANVELLEATGGNRFTMVEGDIRDPETVAGAMDGCDIVCHLAAQVSVARSIDDPDETFKINVVGHHTVMHQAAENKSRFVYASSCAVYGDNDDLPLKETTETRPVSPYAASKLITEIETGGMMAPRPDFIAAGLRFFNVFGPRQPASGGYPAVIPKWISAMRRGERPVLFGDGGATRDFVHVRDICDAIQAAARTDGPAIAGNTVFNVGTGVPTRLDVLFHGVREAFVKAGDNHIADMPDFQPWRDGEILHSLADVSRARKTLGYAPHVDLARGLEDLIVNRWEGPR